ncbi:MAG: phosphohydrolase [Desulfofustis sp.]|nr:phosphohydrolase [Desulfofustis sp.]
MKCPGQDMKYWNQDAIFDAACPQCGQAVEFYKDDTTRTCKQCGHRFVNPKMDFGCAAYCKFAEQCIGTLPEEFVGAQDNLMKDKVAVAMKRFYRNDFKRIGRMLRLARHAEKIGTREGANPALVLCAAYLDGSGLERASERYGSDEPHLVAQESAEQARTVLTELGAKQAMIDDVCQLLAHTGKITSTDSPELRTLADARLITGIEDTVQQGQADNHHPIENLAEQLTSDGGRHEAQAAFGAAGSAS